MKKSKDSIEMWLEQGIDVPGRTVLLQGEVDESLLDRATSAFHLFSDKTEPVIVLLDTPGGDIIAGMAIYDLIKNCASHVTVRVVSQAASMGAVILQAGDVREAYPHAVVMHHVGSQSIGGHSKNVQLQYEFEKKLNDRIDRIMVNRVNEKRDRDGEKQIQLSDWKRHDLWDRWLLADEAIEWGLLDSIFRLKGNK